MLACIQRAAGPFGVQVYEVLITLSFGEWAVTIRLYLNILCFPGLGRSETDLEVSDGTVCLAGFISLCLYVIILLFFVTFHWITVVIYVIPF